jgi:hypothetical protein
MRPRPGEVLHFSEDPTITRFEPHVAATAAHREAYVWAVDDLNAPSYWFPRQCPRAMAWTAPATLPSDRDRIVGVGGGERVHVIEYGWLDALRTTTVYAYRFAADTFRPLGDAALVSTEPVTPLAPPEPVGDLIRCHAEAGIQLRVLPNLWEFWAEVIVSTLDFSGIRLRNALPPRG